MCIERVQQRARGRHTGVRDGARRLGYKKDHERNEVTNGLGVHGDLRNSVSCLYQSSGLLHQGPVHAVHLVVEAAGVAQVVSGAVSTPQGGVYGAAIDALPALCEVLGSPRVDCSFRKQQACLLGGRGE